MDEDFWTPMVARRRAARVSYQNYIIMCLVMFKKDHTYLFERCDHEMCAERKALERILQSGRTVSDVHMFHVLRISVQDRCSIVPGPSMPCSECTCALIKHNIDNVVAMNHADLTVVNLHEHCPYVRHASKERLSGATTPELTPESPSS